METLWLKKEFPIFFQLESIVDKTTFSSWSFKKIIDFHCTKNKVFH